MSFGPRQVVGRKRRGKARGKAIIVYFLETHFNLREWATNPGYRTPRPARRVQGCGGAVVGAPAGTLRFPSSCHARNGSKTEVERKGIVSASLVRGGWDFGGSVGESSWTSFATSASAFYGKIFTFTWITEVERK